jgi:hypothetical protein
MRISVNKIEPAAVLNEISNSESKNIVGGKSQFASLQISASTNNGSASASGRGWSNGNNPYLDFGFSVQVIETEKGVAASSRIFASGGN